MDHVFPDEYPFRFINGPLSLATLASTELSLGLWRHKISNSAEVALDSVLKTNFSCTEFFSVPSRIKDIIDEKIIPVGEDLQKWVKFYSKFSPNLRSVFSANFDDVVFDPNGRISYSKSAAKAIKRNDIGDEIKFKIACTFCLEDEIRQQWPSISTSFKFDNSCSAYESMSLYYWFCLMTSNQNTGDTISIKSLIWNEYLRRQNWASLRYFWRNLNDELKAPTALKIFRHNNIDSFICLLPTLNKRQAQEIFETKACEILSMLVSNHEYAEHVLALWTHMENVISEGVFLKLIQDLWKITWNVSITDRMRWYKVDGILTEIWTRAPDRLRSYVLNRSAGFFDRLPSWQSPAFVFNYGHNMEFLLDLLRNNSAEFRKTVWSENWEKIVMRSKPVYLKQFLELCLPDDKAISDFKSDELLCFRDIIFSFIRHGLYAELAEYLNFCSKTTVVEKETSKKILKNNMGVIISSVLNGNNFENFNSFVDGLFSDIDSATEFKHKLLLSLRSVRSLFVIFNKGRLNDCQQIIGRFATSEDNLQEMKTKFLNHSRKSYLTSVQTMEFNAQHWDELLNWCTKNKDEIAAFKKSLDINAIFEFCFNTYASKSWDLNYRHFRELYFYDSFSNWYFDDEQEKRDFKLEKVNTYDKGKAICKFLSKASRFSIWKMLKWAFDSDEKKMMKFQQKLVRDKVLSSVITADIELAE